MRHRVFSLFPVAICFFGFATDDSYAQKLYYAQSNGNFTDGEIRRADLDGSVAEVLVDTGDGQGWGIALDRQAGKMYWVESVTNKIRRANLNGSQVEDIIAIGLSFPIGIALDLNERKMYWTELFGAKIRRANLDGSDAEILIASGLQRPRGIALDLKASKMYWVEQSSSAKIKRANLDGSAIEDLTFPGLVGPQGITLDIDAGKMYWTVHYYSTKKIQRANLDGSNVEDLVTTGLDQPRGIALDRAAGTLYVCDGSGVQRVNLDGSNLERLVSGATATHGIALDLTPCGGPDCQPNGTPDGCDIRHGTSADCNTNEVPDECDIASGQSDDCNTNGIPDECESQADCNGNTTLDICELADGASADCNHNNAPDECDIADGTSQDCDGDGIPADCEPDCLGTSVFYALVGDRNALLATLDPQSGLVLESHPITKVEALTGGLTSNAHGTLYSLDGWNDAHFDRLFEIDPLSREGRVIGETGFNWNHRYMCMDPVTGRLYGGTDDKLYTIDERTGVATLVREYVGVSRWVVALAINSDGDAYIANRNSQSANLYRLDLATARATLVGALAVGSWVGFGNLTFDENGVLYGARSGGGVYTIDTTDASTTFLFDGTYEGLAFVSRGSDCNLNGIEDDKDIAKGTSLDCNANQLPDECEPDCQPNGVPDDCDLDAGSDDCNTNGVPDECEPDCQPNGVSDECDLRDGTSLDCNNNAIPDECDSDCQPNGLPDDCDIAAGNSVDCNSNTIPDECEPDCQDNGVADECDISGGASTDCNRNDVPDECDVNSGASEDCNTNGYPDECEPDCQSNGIPDVCDIRDGSSLDCNVNAMPDECEMDCNGNLIPDDCDVADGTSTDCNQNGEPDECERDCNANGQVDECDISDGNSTDDNGNGVPDECEPSNDACQNALSIFRGESAFIAVGASSDGPPLDYGCQIICDPWPCYFPDIWYEFVAPYTSRVDISVVNAQGYSEPVLVYEDCDCPVGVFDSITCGLWGPAAFIADAGSCYKLQVGAADAGTITVSTDAPDECPKRRPAVLFVDADSPLGGDGSSWNLALNDLTVAIALASAPGFPITEIRVAEGAYRPAVPNGDRFASFQLPPCVEILGGFAGIGQPNPNMRDVDTYMTVLSGDLNADDPSEISNCCYSHRPGGCSDAACEAAVCAESASCCGLYWMCGEAANVLCSDLCSAFGENSFHVITARGVDEDSVLDGFTITGGNADGPSTESWGGGVYCERATPTIRSCQVTKNIAADAGGGVFNCDGTIVDCQVSHNVVDYGTGGGLEECDGEIRGCHITENAARFGGGLNDCDATIADCRIMGNWADVGGGGLSRCNGSIERSEISGNTSMNSGGGVFDCGGTLTSCVISGNSAALGGGGLSDCDAAIRACTIVGNRVTSFLPVYGAMMDQTGPITSTVFSGDWESWAAPSGQLEYSCIPPGHSAGPTNIAAEPLFLSPGNWNADGRWIEGDYRLTAESPVINIGDPGFIADPHELDLKGQARVLCGRIDGGAFEFGIGDINCDRAVNLLDFAEWDSCMTGPDSGPYLEGCAAFDYDTDWDVDLRDGAALAAEWKDQD